MQKHQSNQTKHNRTKTQETPKGHPIIHADAAPPCRKTDCSRRERTTACPMQNQPRPSTLKFHHHLACNNVGKMIFFMEVQYCVKHNLEFPENSFNWFPSISENTFVPFLPNQIHKNCERNSSHSRLQAFFVVL